MTETYNYSYPTGLAPLPEELVEDIEFDLQLTQASDELPFHGAFQTIKRHPQPICQTNFSRGG